MVVVLLLLLSSLVPHSLADDFTTVEQRLYDTLIPSNLGELYNNAKEYSSTLQPGGYWKDINYTDPNRVIWPAATHLSRLQEMATAYVTPGQPFYKNSSLFNQVNSALNYWLTKDYINPNWWWNEISVPTSIAQIGLLLKPYLTSTQLTGCVKIMDRANWTGWTGANLVWMANVHVYRGFITNNESDVSDGLAHIYGEISIADGINDGIKVDGSFYQHGPQLYNGGYGAVFTASILPYLNITVNTSYYIGASELALFGLMVLDGQQWMTILGCWDAMVIGRGITRAPGIFTNDFNPTLLSLVGGPRHQEYVDFALRLQLKMPQLIGNRHYWKADYMVHHRETYSASIRMYSTRTYNSECVNEEGLKSLHLADGVFNLYQTGKEFDNIYPAWDWERIPGTTCALGEVPISCETLKVLGKTTFVGGVSNGVYGAAAHDFRAALNGKLSARKSWFLFENEIVALGSNITCGGCKHPIVTTINQCLLEGDVYASNSSSPIPSGNRTLENIWWVYHDNVGYVFPHTHSLGLANGVQIGTWESINIAYSGTVKVDVFNFWINQKDGGDTYAYYVLPNATLSDFANTANRTIDAVQILSNTPSLQAVYHSELQVLEAVFWEAGTINFKSSINHVTTSSSLIVLVSVTKQSVSVYVSDPSQRPKETVEVRIGMKSSGKGCVVDGSETVLTFNLPTGEYAGQTMAIECTL